MGRYRNTSDSGSTAIAVVLLAIFAMPIVGICMLFSKNESEKGWGLVLTVLGFLLWFAMR